MVDQSWPYPNVGGYADETLPAALSAAENKVRELIDRLIAKVDAIDLSTADWGDVGDLNHIADQLRNAVGEGD